MILPNRGCFTLRSTKTVTVLSILSLTTVPVRVRFSLESFITLESLITGHPSLSILSLRGRYHDALCATRWYWSFAASQLAYAGQIAPWSATAFLVANLPQIWLSIHSPSCYAPTCLITNVVAIGNFAYAKRNASRANVSFTPSISYNILPG